MCLGRRRKWVEASLNATAGSTVTLQLARNRGLDQESYKTPAPSSPRNTTTLHSLSMFTNSPRRVRFNLDPLSHRSSTKPQTDSGCNTPRRQVQSPLEPRGNRREHIYASPPIPRSGTGAADPVYEDLGTPPNITILLAVSIFPALLRGSLLTVVPKKQSPHPLHDGL